MFSRCCKMAPHFCPSASFLSFFFFFSVWFVCCYCRPSWLAGASWRSPTPDFDWNFSTPPPQRSLRFLHLQSWGVWRQRKLWSSLVDMERAVVLATLTHGKKTALRPLWLQSYPQLGAEAQRKKSLLWFHFIRHTRSLSLREQQQYTTAASQKIWHFNLFVM